MPAAVGLKFLIVAVEEALTIEPICTLVWPRMSRIVPVARVTCAFG